MNTFVPLPLRCDVSGFALSVVLGSTIVMVVALFIARLLENNAAARHGVLATAMLAVLVCPGVTVVMQCLGVRWLKIPMPMVGTPASAEAAAAIPLRGANEEHGVAGVRHSDPAGNRGAVGGPGAERNVSAPALGPPSPSPLAVERPEAHGEDVVRERTSVSGASLLAAIGRIGLIVWGFGAARGCLGIARG